MNTNNNLQQENFCRVCSSKVKEVISLGSSSPANNFVNSKQEASSFFPLVVDFCHDCFCVQLRLCLDEEILYKDYTYMTPNVDSLTFHYEELVKFLENKNILSKKKKCLEIGSNTGLFIEKLSPHAEKVIGIDPAENIAKLANESGYETICDFFNLTSANSILRKYGQMDLLIARHMFAHNENPKILLQAMDNLLTDEGSIMIENAYVVPTLRNGEFDQIYHEHMFYYSVTSMQNLLATNYFELFDLMDSRIHGGSITFLGARKGKKKISPIIEEFIQQEKKLFEDEKIFHDFNAKIVNIKSKVLKEIHKDIKEQKKIAAYGASAKAFTMFSFLGLDSSKISYCIDTTPTKIGKYFPGFSIKVISEEDHLELNADTILVTAWNYKDHILDKASRIFKKGTKLIFPLPNFDIQIVN